MKTTTYMVLLFAAALLVCLVVLQCPSPLSVYSQDDCVWWLKWDRGIHEDYLTYPENISIGTKESHQQWVNDFTEIIARIKKEPCKLTKEECIQLLYKAQASHAGSPATDYYTVHWNAQWFEAYGKIIQYMKSQ